MKPTDRPPFDDAAPLSARAGLERACVLATMIAVGGPSLLVMLADTHAGNFAAATQAGAGRGHRLLPPPLLPIPALAIVQELAVRIGVFSQCGFGESIRGGPAPRWGWIAPAIVSALACACGLGEIFGLRRSLERGARHRLDFMGGHMLWVVDGALLALFAPDLLSLSIGAQVSNAAFFPMVGAMLVILPAIALPESAHLRGWCLWLTAATASSVAVAGLAGAFAGFP